jgi:hypothetical protein
MGRRKVGAKAELGATRKEVLIQTRVPDDVAGWVAEMAYETGDTASGWIRRLVMRDYRQSRVEAMVRHKSNCDPLPLLAHFSATHYLAPTSHITALDREFLLVNLEREPLRRDEIIGQAWFREASDHRFILEGSPTPWRIITLIGSAITLHADLEWTPPAESSEPVRPSRKSR